MRAAPASSFNADWKFRHFIAQCWIRDNAGFFTVSLNASSEATAEQYVRDAYPQLDAVYVSEVGDDPVA